MDTEDEKFKIEKQSNSQIARYKYSILNKKKVENSPSNHYQPSNSLKYLQNALEQQKGSRSIEFLNRSNSLQHDRIKNLKEFNFKRSKEIIDHESLKTSIKTPIEKSETLLPIDPLKDPLKKETKFSSKQRSKIAMEPRVKNLQLSEIDQEIVKGRGFMPAKFTS